MTSKWSEGIEPRGFRWIIAERFGVCERPGGYGVGHRRVRRLEEIIWLRRNEIGLIISLTSIPYNLHDYQEQGLAYVHLPLSDSGDSQRLGRYWRRFTTASPASASFFTTTRSGTGCRGSSPVTCCGRAWSTAVPRPSPSPSNSSSVSSAPLHVSS